MTSRSFVAVVAIALGALMFGLEISSVPVALPLIGDTLDTPVTRLQWVVTAYTIASVAVLVAAGVLADRLGRRRILLLATVGFALASAVCGSASNLGVLVAGRAAQGLCGGAMMICGLAALSHRFPESRDRARAFGLWGVGLGVGLGTGPLIGLGLITFAGWRGVFLVHVPLSVLAVLLTRRSLPESHDPAPGRLDLPGMAAAALGVTSVVYLINQAPTNGLTSTPCLAAAAATVVAVLGFAVAERRAVDPMVPVWFFRTRSFTGALTGAVGMNFSFWPLIVYVPLALERGSGAGTAAATVVLLGFTVPTFLLPPIAERLALRFGPARTIPVGLAVIGLGLGLVALAAATGASWGALLPGAVIAGTGLGITNTPVTNTTTSSVPPQNAGTASAVDLSVRFTTLSVSTAIMGTLVGGSSATAGFAHAALFATIAVIAFAVASAAVFGRLGHSARLERA